MTDAELRQSLNLTHARRAGHRIPADLRSALLAHLTQARSQGAAWTALPEQTGIRATSLARMVTAGRLRSTEVAVIFCSLIETAHRIGLDPKAYLLAAALAAIRDPKAPLLLPHEFAAQQAPTIWRTTLHYSRRWHSVKPAVGRLPPSAAAGPGRGAFTSQDQNPKDHSGLAGLRRSVADFGGSLTVG